MKQALHKSEIPPSKIFIIRHLTEKHFDPSWHAHSEYQLFVVLKGTGTRFIGDSIKSFSPYELIFTGPHLPHVWRSDEIYFSKEHHSHCEGIVIYFNENFLGEHIMDKEEMFKIKKLFEKSLRGLEFYGPKKNQAIELMRELVHLTGIQSVIQLLTILHILAESGKFHYISSKPFDESFKQDETERLNLVYEYVFQNFSEKISLKDVADLVHMTPTSFSRYFTMKNNISFSEFISEIRVKNACKLLIDSEEPISKICYDCGYNTLSNFNKQFKEINSISPTQYRKEYTMI